jgi:hypothetical protein
MIPCSRRRIFQCAWNLLLFLIAFTLVIIDNDTSIVFRGHRSLYDEAARKRPIIYTFFNPLLEDAFVTEMSLSGDESLLQLWKQTWSDVGFEPIVLSLNDAKSHPMYLPLHYAMDHTWLDGYNKMCIWRWVAMSNVGGGWMSDYDVFPLRYFETHPLPHNGSLTVHDRFIPDLVSGSAEEWIRVAHDIVSSLLERDAIQKEKVEKSYTLRKRQRRRFYTLWTDMMALHEWSQTKPDQFQNDSRVFGRPFETRLPHLGIPWTSELCRERTPSKIVAVHFSHDAIKRGIELHLVHDGQVLDNRAEIAREWLTVWNSSCYDTI